MDVPLIKKFEAGFIAGAKSVNPDVQVISLYTGSFTDQAKGKELGLSLIDQGADVIYAAAGAMWHGHRPGVPGEGRPVHRRRR